MTRGQQILRFRPVKQSAERGRGLALRSGGRMQSLRLALIAVVVFGVSFASAEQGRARGQKQGNATQVNIAFAPRDIELIRTHYASQYRNLPPGLQKKLARGGSLPPGWEKKLERFPAGLERDLVVLPPGHARGVMDGHAVIYNPITHAILDIASLF